MLTREELMREAAASGSDGPWSDLIAWYPGYLLAL